MDRSGTDAYIRAYFMKDDPDYTSKEWLDNTSPEQFDILKKMQRYLKTGEMDAESMDFEYPGIFIKMEMNDRVADPKDVPSGAFSGI